MTFDFDYDASTADTTLRVRVQRMEESWTRGNQTETVTEEQYYDVSSGAFLGASRERGGETVRIDAHWQEMGRTVDINAISDVLASGDGRAYTLFGAAKYKVTDSWSDRYMSFTETTYYDAVSGAKLGVKHQNVQSHGQDTFTNTSYQDANGEFLGDEWSDGYSSGFNTSSEGIQTLSAEQEWLDLNGNGTAGETVSVTVFVNHFASEWTDHNQRWF